MNATPIELDAPTVRAIHEKRTSKREALRALLSPGLWVHMRELMRVGGTRYGARLMELRRGRGGYPPMAIHVRQVGVSEYAYRADELPQMVLGCVGPCCTPERPRERRRKLEARIGQLEEALQRVVNVAPCLCDGPGCALCFARRTLEVQR